jgi:hypothetical protein
MKAISQAKSLKEEKIRYRTTWEHRKILKLIPSFSNLILPLKEIKSSYFMILDKRVNLKLQVVLSNHYTNCSSPRAFIYSSSSSSSYKHKKTVSNKNILRIWAKELNTEKDYHKQPLRSHPLRPPHRSLRTWTCQTLPHPHRFLPQPIIYI